MVGENEPWHMMGLRILLRERGLTAPDGTLNVTAVEEAFAEKPGTSGPAAVDLRQWAFGQARQICPGAPHAEAIESADAILAWVTKRNSNG